MLDTIAPYFKGLYDDTGWNFVIFYEQYEYDRLVEGIGVSIQLIIASLIFSLVVGIIGAWAQRAKSVILRYVIAGYIQVFRNTPPFVQILFFYFVLGNLTPSYDAGGYQVAWIGNFGWAVISLGFFAGAFNVEIFRSGIEAVPDSTKEAASALGYTRLQSYIHVIFRHGNRHSRRRGAGFDAGFIAVAGATGVVVGHAVFPQRHGWCCCSRSCFWCPLKSTWGSRSSRCRIG